MQGGHLSPAVARLGANRALAAQVNKFQAPPAKSGASDTAAPGHQTGLSTDEMQILRHYLAALGRR